MKNDGNIDYGNGEEGKCRREVEMVKEGTRLIGRKKSIFHTSQISVCSSTYSRRDKWAKEEPITKEDMEN